MAWGINRKVDQKKSRKAELELKRIIEKDNEFELYLTQKHHEDSGGKGPYFWGQYIAGDADLLSKKESKRLVHCEIKEKYPDKYGHYGIELYRVAHFFAIEKKFKIPTYYVIKDTSLKCWVYRRFKSLWEKLKEGFLLFFDYNQKISGVFTINNEVFKKIILYQNTINKIFMNYAEIEPYCSKLEGYDKIYGKIRLDDRSYYKGTKLNKATLVYFNIELFKSLERFIPEIRARYFAEMK